MRFYMSYITYISVLCHDQVALQKSVSVKIELRIGNCDVSF